jgi:hypothetical protein
LGPALQRVRTLAGLDLFERLKQRITFRLGEPCERGLPRFET